MTEERFAPGFVVKLDDADLPPVAAAAITELSVTRQRDTMDECTLTLANPFPEMRWTHDPRHWETFREGSALTVALGYGSTLQPMFDGEITKLSPTFPESGTPTLRIEGHSRLHRLSGTSKSRTFVDMTDSDIAAQIASDLKLQLDADTTDESHEYIIQLNETDLAFLRDRARRIGYTVAVEGDKLFFKKGAQGEASRLTLVYGPARDAPAGDATFHPLSSFSPTVNVLKPFEQVIVRGQDPKTRAPIEGRAAAADLTATLGGKRKGTEVAAEAVGSRVLTVVDRVVASVAEAKALAYSLFENRALDYVTGSGSTIGLPALRAGDVLTLLGLGRFSNRYIVTKVTHSIGSSGFTTSFDARSDSLP